MLTEEQMNRLYVYCHKKGIRYYDLKTELVDHMATAIEEEWEQHPKETFDVVANRIAPVFAAEWPTLVKETKRQLMKEYLRLIAKSFLQYFTWPKIGLTALLMTGAVLINLHGNLHRFPGFFLQMLVMTGYSFSFSKRGKQVVQNNKDKKEPLLCWSLLNDMQYFVAAIPIGYLSVNISSWLTPEESYSPFLFSLSLFLAPLAILLLLSWRKVYIEVNERIRQNYSGAFKAPVSATHIHV